LDNFIDDERYLEEEKTFDDQEGGLEIEMEKRKDDEEDEEIVCLLESNHFNY